VKDVLYQYYEDLLCAQYDVSDTIVKQHQLAKGTIREDFLKEWILKLNQSFKISKGFLHNNHNNDQSGECDLIFYPNTVTAHPLGQQTFINVDDCPLIIEVKSNATGTDLKKTNQNFNIIKQLSPNHQPICGLFCYNVALEKNKILKRFGFSYDDDLDAWTQMENSPLYYSSIDFMMHLATSHEKECLQKNNILYKKIVKALIKMN